MHIYMCNMGIAIYEDRVHGGLASWRRGVLVVGGEFCGSPPEVSLYV